MRFISQCNNAILKAFYRYGHMVGKHPVFLMVGCVLLCGALASGLARLDVLTDMEELYAPETSQASRNRETILENFPDLTGSNYDSFGLPADTPRISFIFRSREGANILDNETLQEIKPLLDHIKTITVTHRGGVFTYDHLCARSENQCVLSGDFIFSQNFRASLDAGQVTIPASSAFPGEDLSLNIGQPWLNGTGASNLPVLRGAESLFFNYPMRTDHGLIHASKDWVEEVLDLMEELVSNYSLPLDVAYTSADSLNTELNKSTGGDIVFFAMTFALMITYASIVSAGGNMVSTRAFLSMGGVLATCLGIVASFGLVTLCGVQYVNMAGIMPFLLLGVGVDDMFLLMSSWSETTDHPEMTVPQRIGTVFQKAGIGITITSVTNFLSFAIGSTSVFRSVRNFCIYTGAGVIMCYLANISFFGGCLALHGKRIYSNRHMLTCRRVKSRAELQAEGHSSWYSMLCGGEKPQRAMEDQSACERGPSYGLPRLIMWMPVRVIVTVLFVANLGIAIWGCSILKQGLDLKDLVLSSSYVHKFENWHKEDYGLKLPISFVKTGHLDYRDPKTLEEMTNLITEAQKDDWISRHIDVCWLTTFAKTPLYDNSTDAAFNAGLKAFLQYAPRFQNDVVMKNGTIVASRCHVYSNKVADSNDQAQLMVRMRDLADESPVADMAFHWAFIYYEQFILILPTTLQTVGITIAVMCVVTAFFLPQPLIVLMVMVQVVMIVTCIFGYMALWGLTLSSITMVHLIMSVGLSVDFCAHVCTAYMVSDKATREGRAKDAIVHASGPILNGGTSSMVGILGLLFSESFIFQSFFKVMLLVIGFGVAHAVFFVPVLLSFLGPRNYVKSESDDEDRAAATITNGRAKVSPHNDGHTGNTSIYQQNGSSYTNGTSLHKMDDVVQTTHSNNIELHYLENGHDSKHKNCSLVSAAEITRNGNMYFTDEDADETKSDMKGKDHCYVNSGLIQDNKHLDTTGTSYTEILPANPTENGYICHKDNNSDAHIVLNNNDIGNKNLETNKHEEESGKIANHEPVIDTSKSGHSQVTKSESSCAKDSESYYINQGLTEDQNQSEDNPDLRTSETETHFPGNGNKPQSSEREGTQQHYVNEGFTSDDNNPNGTLSVGDANRQENTQELSENKDGQLSADCDDVMTKL